MPHRSMKDLGWLNMKVIQAVVKKVAHVTSARTASQTGTRKALKINPI